MRRKVGVVLLVVLLWIAGAVSSSAFQSSGDSFPGEDQIDLNDPRIGQEFAQQFRRGDCGAEVCAEESPIVFMPYGCEGKSDNPHKSHHAKDPSIKEITGKSKTTCAVKIRRVTAANQLWRSHLIIWGREGQPGFHTKRDARRVEAVAVAACNNDRYLVTATHTLVGNNGRIYVGASGKTASVTCD